MAARLQPVAPPGSVAVSEMIRRVCEGYFNFRGLGPTAIKGIGEPVEVYEVTGLGTLRTHFELCGPARTHHRGRPLPRARPA